MLRLRTAAGLSQDDLGHLIGVTDQAIYKVEKGQSRPHRKNLERMAEVLGVSPTYLEYGIEPHDGHQELPPLEDYLHRTTGLTAEQIAPVRRFVVALQAERRLRELIERQNLPDQNSVQKGTEPLDSEEAVSENTLELISDDDRLSEAEKRVGLRPAAYDRQVSEFIDKDTVDEE